MSAAACSQTGCSGLAPAPELSPYGAPAAATSPCRAFMNKLPLIPNSYLISFLLNLTHTSLANWLATPEDSPPIAERSSDGFTIPGARLTLDLPVYD